MKNSIEYYEILMNQISFFCKINDTSIFNFPINKIEEVHGGGYNLHVAKKYTTLALNFIEINNIKKY